ncbi:MAG: hypothetical protein JW908_00510 [Anaerolineales bacterium]|nr:hypothetical protein [Anaerolineales bacterium]
MELMKIELNLASRWLLVRMLNQCPDHTPADSRMIRDIRKRFELKQAQKEQKRMVRDRSFEIWETDEKLKEEENKYREAKAKGEAYEIDREIEVPDGIDWDDLSETKARTFTVDDSYIAWLKTQYDKAEWGKIKRVETNGKMVVDEILVTASMSAALADLDDALHNSRPARAKDDDALSLKDGA